MRNANPRRNKAAVQMAKFSFSSLPFLSSNPYFSTFFFAMNFGDLPPQQPRKSKFKPKPPPRRLRAPKREPDADEGRAGLEILQRFQEISKNRKLGGTMNSSTPSAKPDETGTVGYSGNSNNFGSSMRDGNQRALCLPSPDVSADAIVSSNSIEVVTKKVKKDYIEPCDPNGHYPTVLPLRRPSSEDPEILNNLEFGENQIMGPNESCATHATELGLYEYRENPEFFLVQLPAKFPIPRQYCGAQRSDTKGKEKVTSAPAPARDSGGPIGKMLVYNSGKIKWEMGGILFDVSPGIHSEYMAQDIVAMNTNENTYCEVGKVEKKMTVTQDIDFLLDSIQDLNS